MHKRGLNWLISAGFLSVAFLAACNSEVLEKQAAQIKQQEEEIAAQRREIEAVKAGQKIQDQKQRDCNRAFREFFEKAQAADNRDRAIALYRDGLALCPDDDIAHYELGKVLAFAGRSAEARKEFEAALKINPGFVEARHELEGLEKNR